MMDMVKCMVMAGSLVCAVGLQGCGVGEQASDLKKPRFIGHGHDVGSEHEKEKADGVRVKRMGRMDYPALSEVSGIVRAHPDEKQWWVMNDSGNDAIVYAIDEKGQLLKEVKVAGARNVDWEDIAIEDGRLFVSDLGNNGNARENLGVYAVGGVLDDVAGGVDVTWYGMKYEDQDTYPAAVFEFDCEAIFFLDGKFAVLTKHRMGQTRMANQGTKLYMLDELKVGEMNVLRKIDERSDVGYWVTGADVSPSGDRLVVLGQTELWVFDRPMSGSDRWLSEGVCWKMSLPAEMMKQAEGVCWDDDQMIRIVNEQRDVYVLDVVYLERYGVGFDSNEK
ncbi:hypothetical protein KS4_06300 [Poriferisphaera corsica]|uniref:Lipoprotein n=2 Tax=Poriferisphaera corsica TaxID=2528020 RepID=A0A517YQT3_9BACT|nr:hypothetical protein KS4_06300 [Poriferisphaera corsica]